MEEQLLIERARQKDGAAFTRLIQSCMAEIDVEISSVLGALLDEAEKTELDKTVIVTTWNRMTDCPREPKPFHAWLAKLTQEICLDHLIVLAKHGNAPAFASLIKQYEWLIRMIIQKFQRVNDQTEDIVQHVTIDAWRKIALRFEFTPKSLKKLRQTTLPVEVLEKLHPLQRQGFQKKRPCIAAIINCLGAEQTRLYQDVILRAVKVKRFKKGAVALKAWLRRRTTGICLDLLKNPEDSREPENSTFTEIATNPGNPLVDAEHNQLLNDALQSERLSVSERHIHSLRLAGLTNQQIAQIPLLLFKLTTDVFEELQVENIPDTVIAKLKPLRNQEFLSEAAFLAEVAACLGKKPLAEYQERILKHVRRKLSNQQIAEIYNHGIKTLQAIFREQGMIP